MELEYEPEDEPIEEPDIDPERSYSESGPPGRGGRPVFWVVLVVALVAAGAIALWLLPKDEPGPPAEVGTLERSDSVPAPELEEELGSDLDEETRAVEIPSLERSDDVVRQLVSELSSHPELSRWLATDRLVHRFVATVDNLAEGTDPRKHLPVQSLDRPFETSPGGGAVRVSPESYQRYDSHAAIFVSLDPEGTARLYTLLKPRIQEAYRELGYPNRSFDETLVEAIRHLLATPIPESPPTVVPRVRGWAFEDPRLEALSPSQKVLIRMGPDNGEAVKSHLRRLARALGVPKDRLGT